MKRLWSISIFIAVFVYPPISISMKQSTSFNFHGVSGFGLVAPTALMSRIVFFENVLPNIRSARRM
ncbi:MAG: hypothetical protein F4219_00820 [Gammaproteobacteria bacterium]|nr:hypothetical protein [Gammaproteobacteria bacterium]